MYSFSFEVRFRSKVVEYKGIWSPNFALIMKSFAFHFIFHTWHPQTTRTRYCRFCWWGTAGEKREWNILRRLHNSACFVWSSEKGLHDGSLTLMWLWKGVPTLISPTPTPPTHWWGTLLFFELSSNPTVCYLI